MIPIILKLKKAGQKEIAKAQDLIVQGVYEVFNDAFFHGGTCIWRCYSGNRFSEDVDMYLSKDKVKIDKLFKLFEKKGFLIEKKKISENSIYSSLNLNRVMVRFKAIFKKEKGELREYETAEGNLLTVYAPSPERLIEGKVNAYLNRLKIRDLYDIFFLLRYVDDATKIKRSLNELVYKFKKPIDEENLKILIIEGIVPTAAQMLDYIKRRTEHG